MLERHRFAVRNGQEMYEKLRDAAKRRGLSPVYTNDAALHVVLHTVADDGCA